MDNGIFDEGEVYDLMTPVAEFVNTGGPDYQEVTYRCTKCGAEDHDRLFPGAPVILVLNCFQCHAGLQMSLDEMRNECVGMFPVAAAEAEPEIAN